MRCGILLIGSLLWEGGAECRRVDWREARLDIHRCVSVRVPIYYGRQSRSRGDTYTMTFSRGKPTGQAMLIACTAEIKTIENLIAEANALWKAEAPNATQGTLHKSWGCVGALFGPSAVNERLAADWTGHFQRIETRCVSVVNSDGLLNITWPNMLNGKPADFDVILATTTKPEAEPPTAHTVADAWAGQDAGHESYFFNNVKHGIRTSDDIEIWRRLEEQAPPWLRSPKYEEAIAMLRVESKSL